MDECRKQFEAWAQTNGYKITLRNDPNSPDTYFTSETEVRWVCWKSAYQAGMREAAKICYDIDREYEGEDVYAIWCMNDILKAAEFNIAFEFAKDLL